MRARIAGWTTIGAGLLLGLAGAAATPEGVRFGLPSAWHVLLVAALVGLAARSGEGRVGLGALPCVAAALLSPWIPALGYFTGGPLVALTAGVLIATLGPPPWERRLFVPVVVAVFALTAWRVQHAVGPEGDEPQYLAVADSLLHDHDLEVGSDFEAGRYRAFHPATIEPHYRVRGRDGRIYSLHAVGLSVLILPAYALGGYPAASFFMAALAAWLAVEIRKLVAEASGREEIGAAVGWLIAFSPPLLPYAGLVFTEVPAALVVALALRHVVVREKPAHALAIGAALAFLPWLNVRYAPLTVILIAVALWRTRDGRFVAPAAASAVAIMAYHQAIYGFLDPRRVYGRRVEMDPATIPSHLPGVFLDQEFGLFVYAPILVLAVVGLARRGLSTRVRATAAALVTVVVLVTSSWPMWRGGFNPPSRFLVPVTAPLAVGLAGAALGPGAALAAGWGTWIGAEHVAQPWLLHRDRDFGAPLFRVRSGAREWTRILPGWVLDEDRPAAPRLTLVWAALLALMIVGRRRTPASMAVAQVAVIVAVLVADRLAVLPPTARDAVRLGDGAWGAERLPFAGLYEPHRYPEGVVIGPRLPLPAGQYEVVVDGDRLAAGEPRLEIDVEPGGRRPAPGNRFAVDGERAVSLRLAAGPPIQVRRILLRRVQP